MIGCFLATGLIIGLYYYYKPQLPSVDVLKDVHLQTPLQIYTSDGKLISQYGIKRRIPLKLSEIPQPLIDAVIATEDSRFYEHPGIDFIGVFRAAVNLIRTGERSQGASTLTMQLARGFFLSREKKFERKIKEIFIALAMEQVLSKDEILELYLNKYELGHRAFGVGAAAQVYYGKNVQELTLAQMATIAGLHQAPSLLNPISHPSRSMERRRIVLLRMLDEGYINKDQYMEAVAAPVTARLHGAEIEVNAPYVADLAYQEMVRRYGREEAETMGYKVYLTTPSDIQQAATDAVIQNLHDYDERHGYRGPIAQLWPADQPTPVDETQILDMLSATPAYSPLTPAAVLAVQEQSIDVVNKDGTRLRIDWDGLAWARQFISDIEQGPDPQTAADIAQVGQLIYIRQNQQQQWQISQIPDVTGAFVALDPLNGAIRALVGGYNFYHSEFNRATQAKRQVGSNIKPFVYSSALEHGFTPASIINDAPINQWDRASGLAWRPKNSPEEYDGPIRMRVALGKSKNVVSVRLLRAVGLDNVINHLANFGFNPKELPRDESLALGSASLTPLQVATGFSTFANGGFLVEPYLVERVENIDGDTIWQANPALACRECVLTNLLDTPTEPDTTQQTREELESSQSLEAPKAPRVISADNAFLMTDMMRTALKTNGKWGTNTYWQGTGWRAANLLHRDDVAGKTGTTNDARDTWFSGFTPNLVATSWVGFDDMSRMLGRTSANQYLINQNPQRYNWLGNAMVGGEDGARVAQPAWIRFMQQALLKEAEQEFFVPPNIVTVRIDRSTGKLTQRSDFTSRFEYFKAGTQPTQFVRDDEIEQTQQTEQSTLGDIF
nr:penicillin-binding protein 1A [Bowmanella sp. JS7-9]